MSSRAILVAVAGAAGLLGAAWAHKSQQSAHAARRHHGRRRVGRRAHRHAKATAAHAHPVQQAAAATAPSGAASGGGAPLAGKLVLLLFLLLSTAAVRFAEQLRPDGMGSREWQRTLAAGVVALAALLSWLLHGASAAASRRRAAAAHAHAAQAAAAAAAAAGCCTAPAAVQAAPPQDLTGVWIKDKAASESMEDACNVMQLSGLIRTAIKIIKGLELKQDGQQFTMSVLSGILWFKITERYPLDGSKVWWKRRDLRKGQHEGWVERCPATGGLLLRVEWAPPFGGSGVDRFHLVAPDEMHCDSLIIVNGQKVQYRSIYHRKT